MHLQRNSRSNSMRIEITQLTCNQHVRRKTAFTQRSNEDVTLAYLLVYVKFAPALHAPKNGLIRKNPLRGNGMLLIKLYY